MARSPVGLAVALAAVVACSCGTAVVGLLRAPAERPTAAVTARPVAAQPVAQPAAVPAADVLRAWDRARSHAWAAGDVRVLRELYTPGSVAGRRDVAMLRSYLDRGLVVQGLETQLLAVEELSRGPTRWVLRVTDRIASGTALGRGVQRALPQDGATTATLTLRRVGDGWRVASVSRSR